MSIAEARKSLMSERRVLLDQVEMIDKALAVLDGEVPAKSRRAGTSKSKSKPKKTSRADLTTEQALERYGAEALTCSVCGRVSRAPQGMKAHMRSHSN